jgi:hypothetical protein
MRLIRRGGMGDKAGQSRLGGTNKTSRELMFRLDDFTWNAVTEESLRLGVSAEDLARFSLLYYLADLDSGRVARRIPGKLVLTDA